MNPEKTLMKITCQERNKARKARGREVEKKEGNKPMQHFKAVCNNSGNRKEMKIGIKT